MKAPGQGTCRAKSQPMEKLLANPQQPSSLPILKRRVVVVGGGAGGLELAIRLAHEESAAVHLVDARTTHVWKPRLHEVAVGIADAQADAVSYLSSAKRHGFSFHWGALEAVDTVRRMIGIGAVKDDAGDVLPVRQLHYDTLVLAIGSRVNDFGVPGVTAHCHMLDSAEQATRFQHEFLRAAQRVAAGQQEWLSVGIVGAGATGVELAAELCHAVRELEAYGGGGVKEKLQITLIDMAPRVLPAADERTSSQALASLYHLKVIPKLGQSVERVDERGIALKGGAYIDCSLKVWASGVIGLDVLSSIPGLSVGRGKRVAVDPYLACQGVDNIYAIGDCAAAPGLEGGATLPPTAQVAHQQAAYLAAALRTQWRGRESKPFRYSPKGMLVSLGDERALAELPSVARPGATLYVSGTSAKALYVLLFHAHRVTLHGWWRAAALFIADRLRGTSLPRVKLH